MLCYCLQDIKIIRITVTDLSFIISARESHNVKISFWVSTRANAEFKHHSSWNSVILSHIMWNLNWTLRWFLTKALKIETIGVISFRVLKFTADLWVANRATHRTQLTRWITFWGMRFLVGIHPSNLMWFVILRQLLVILST